MALAVVFDPVNGTGRDVTRRQEMEKTLKCNVDETETIQFL